MTTLLAIDTSTEACSVALLHNGERIHSDEMAQRAHTQRILPMIDEILARSGITLKQLDALVFGRGPGSFTGVRVGAGIAQGLAFGADLPVIAISDLTAMAQAVYEETGAKRVISAIDARMNEVYFCQSEMHGSGESAQWHNLIEEQVAAPEKAADMLANLTEEWVTAGTGWAAYEVLNRLPMTAESTVLLPSAKYMLPLALPCWRQGQVISAVEIEPVYLRNDVAWKKLPGREKL